MFLLLSIITLLLKAQDTISIEGVVTRAEYKFKNEVDLMELDIEVNGGNRTFHYYYGYFEEARYLHRKVKVSFIEQQKLSEVDMFFDGVSIYGKNSKLKNSNQSKINKVDGEFSIIDYGCAMPGRYTITAPDGAKTTIYQYIDPPLSSYKGKIVTAYYSTEKTNFVTLLSFLPTNESKMANSSSIKEELNVNNEKINDELNALLVGTWQSRANPNDSLTFTLNEMTESYEFENYSKKQPYVLSNTCLDKTSCERFKGSTSKSATYISGLNDDSCRYILHLDYNNLNLLVKEHERTLIYKRVK